MMDGDLAREKQAFSDDLSVFSCVCFLSCYHRKRENEKKNKQIGPKNARRIVQINV